MVERHYLRGLVSIAGKQSCEICLAIADTGIGHTHRGIRWPSNTMGQPWRDEEHQRYLARYFQSIHQSFSYRAILRFETLYYNILSFKFYMLQPNRSSSRSLYLQHMCAGAHIILISSIFCKMRPHCLF